MTPTYYEMNEMLTIFMYHEKLIEHLAKLNNKMLQPCRHSTFYLCNKFQYNKLLTLKLKLLIEKL